MQVRRRPERLAHVLYGDRTGGGHKVGYGGPGKTKFPAAWSDEVVASARVGVATAEASARRSSRLGRTVVEGAWQGTYMRAVVEADGDIVTGFPLEGAP